jgi:hypothetical protein
MDDLKKNSKMQCVHYTFGDRTIQVFYPKHSKPIIDRIDSVLAEHYKLDEHQKEFIINFDLQFRRRSDD